MEAIGLIFALLIGVGMCAFLCLITAVFAQWAMKIVTRHMTGYGKAYGIVFKVTLIGFAINILLGQLVQLKPVLVYATTPTGILLWLLLNSYLFGIWFTRRHEPIGFVKGLLVNLIVTAFSLVLVLIIAIPLFFLFYAQGTTSGGQ